jgi:hypothetical protein
MQQMGRNLTDCYDGFLNDAKYILLARDTKFLPFKGVLDFSDTKVVLLPPKSPNLNAQHAPEHRCIRVHSQRFAFHVSLTFFFCSKPIVPGCSSISHRPQSTNRLTERNGPPHNGSSCALHLLLASRRCSDCLFPVRREAPPHPTSSSGRDVRRSLSSSKPNGLAVRGQH